MKKICVFVTVVLFVLTGCEKELKVKVVEKITTEYGETLDNSKLYDSKDSDKNVTVKKVNGYDAKKLGEQIVDVLFTDGKKEIEKQVKILVKDTRKPEIEVKEDEVTITAGNKLNLEDNVKSVKDFIDGDLKYSNQKIEKSGYYIDKGELDTDTEGTYEIKVLAYDVNGNVSEKTFNVIVEKKIEEKQDTENLEVVNEHDVKTTTENNENKEQEFASQSTQQETPIVSNNVEQDVVPISDSLIVQAALAQVGGNGKCSVVAETAIHAVGKSAWIEKVTTFEDGAVLTESSLSPENFTKVGVSVDSSQMRPGDILYYADGGAGGSHVAVYVGNDKAVHGGWLGDSIVVETIHVGKGVSGVYRFD